MDWTRVGNAFGNGIQDYLGSDPAVVAASGRLDVFARSRWNRIENWTHDDRYQQKWVRNNRTGILVSDPSVVHTASDSRMFLFGIGTTGNLFWNVFNNRWSSTPDGHPWSETGWLAAEPDAAGSTVLLGSQPQAIWTGANTIDVFCTRLNADPSITTPEHYTFNTATLTGSWDPGFPDGATFDPGSTVRPLVLSLRPALRMVLMAKGQDNRLWVKLLGRSRTDFFQYDRDGILTSDPFPVKIGETLIVFVRGSDMALWHTEVSFGQLVQRQSNIFRSLSGGLPSPRMCVSSDFRDGFDIFVRGEDKRVWVNHFNASTRVGYWDSLGLEIPAPDSNPTAIFFGGSQQVFARGLDNNLWMTGTLAP